MPPFVVDFDFNEATIEELWDHGLRVVDAYGVLDGRPKFFPDKGNRARRRRGLKPRWLMIGPGQDGAMLTFVIEDPDDDRIAHLVTGWPANADQRTRYARPGGRSNRP